MEEDEDDDGGDYDQWDDGLIDKVSSVNAKCFNHNRSEANQRERMKERERMKWDKERMDGDHSICCRRRL